MRITLFTSSLGAGGAERAVVRLAEGFKQRGHDVAIVSWNNLVSDFYEVPEGVDRFRIELTPSQVSVRWYDLVGNLRRFRAIRHAIGKTNPDIVISFQDGANELFLLSSVGTSYLKLLSCQNDIRKLSHFNSRWDLLRKFIYRWSDQIIFLDKDQARRAEKQFKGWKCDGIPNPVSGIDLVPDSASAVIINQIKKFPLRVAAMGRLVHQKGFDLLLEAFAGVLRVVPEAGLVILGEGELRPELEKQCALLGIKNSVLMPGLSAKPHSIIAACDLFAFSSRYEGQGLALVEAMVCNVVPVSFDCPSGPSLIIRHEVDGLLISPEDVNAFKDGLIMLLLNESKRKMMADKASEVGKRYSIKTVCDEWEKVFDRLQGTSEVVSH